MVRSETVNLPVEQRERLHADFLANEQAYLGMRAQLIEQYEGQWVAVNEGKVICTGTDLHAVTEAAAACTGHPYVARVGHEDRTVFRVRRSAFAYDTEYQPFPLPLVTAAFWNHAETCSQSCFDVIPDTGADHSLLPESDCEAFALFESPYFTAVSGGVLSPGVTTLIYRGKVDIAGFRVPVLIQPVAGFHERIIGRDVLNQLRILFDGPAAQVVIDP